MVNIKRLQEIADEYDLDTIVPATEYTRNHARLCDLVTKYGVKATSIATGLAESTVNQHHRNKHGSAMISDRALNRAESVFAKL